MRASHVLVGGLLVLCGCQAATEGQSTPSTMTGASGPDDTTSSAATGAADDTDPDDSSGETSEPTTATGSTTSTSSDGDADGSTSGNPGDSSTTGGAQVCAPINGDYGACPMTLGWAFDGQDCVEVQGCDCAPDCDEFGDTLVDCVESCAANGYCEEDSLIGMVLVQNFEIGTYCDEVRVCADVNLQVELAQFFPGMVCWADTWCPGEAACILYDHTKIWWDQWDALCELTLVPGVDEIACVVWP